MERNKLENQIQKKLNDREIQPSAQAWDRLDAMLSVTEEKKPKRKFPWFSIAASFTGMFILAMFLLNQSKNQNSIINNRETIVNTIETVKDAENVITDAVIENKIAIKKPTPQNIVTIAESKNQKIKAKNKSQKVQNIVKIVEQPQEIIAEVATEKTIEKKNLEINPESLLVAIEKENIENKTNPKSKIKINPSALLSQVDGEIELSFRQKVIKTINKNYNSTKVALATRNQE
ncbi:hypothetical protein [Flavobacterium sp.]|uniref:hypothetical protein n=1 Tax=Flavobacterium sp. TaxID=239 RepID=UPI00286BEEC7|nr:hypothetical protein [Flavobacterium sp.]